MWERRRFQLLSSKAGLNPPRVVNAIALDNQIRDMLPDDVEDVTGCVHTF